MTKDSHFEASATPLFEKLKLETVRRNVTVKSKGLLTPHMLRVTLEGDELDGFNSPAPDDHVIIFLDQSGEEAVRREFTPRHFDAEKRTLAIDFALHDGGAASAWAQRAQPGDQLRVGGPRGSTVITAPGAWWLLVGDETALPAIGRRLSEIENGTQVIALMTVTGSEEVQSFDTQANLTSHWIHRPLTQAADPAPVIKALSELTPPEGPGIIWIAAESEVARAVRAYCIDTLGHPAEWVIAKSYWSQKEEERE
jgi:NADPH-dependent ferric siderophore reductase